MDFTDPTDFTGGQTAGIAPVLWLERIETGISDVDLKLFVLV